MKRTKPMVTVLDTQSVMLASGITVSYSGMDGSRCVIGDGRITSFLNHTLGIRGDYHVKPGMDLALIVGHSKSDHHLCLVGATVASSTWNTFKVDLREVPETAQTQLKALLKHAQKKPVYACQAA